MPTKHPDKASSQARIISQAKGKDTSARRRYFSPKIGLKQGRQPIKPSVRRGWVS